VQKVDVKFVHENRIEKQATVAKNAQNMGVAHIIPRFPNCAITENENF
jgi:hypothetical protein